MPPPRRAAPRRRKVCSGRGEREERGAQGAGRRTARSTAKSGPWPTSTSLHTERLPWYCMRLNACTCARPRQRAARPDRRFGVRTHAAGSSARRAPTGSPRKYASHGAASAAKPQHSSSRCHVIAATRTHFFFSRIQPKKKWSHTFFEQSRTGSCQGSSVAGQPQCPRLWHRSTPHSRFLS